MTERAGSFGQLTVLISQWFAPTSFVVSGGEGMGVQADWVERDERGKVVGVKLPEQGVWVRPHFAQCRARNNLRAEIWKREERSTKKWPPRSGHLGRRRTKSEWGRTPSTR